VTALIISSKARSSDKLSIPRTSTRLSFLRRHGLSFASDVTRSLLQFIQNSVLSMGRTISISALLISNFFLLCKYLRSFCLTALERAFYEPQIRSRSPERFLNPLVRSVAKHLFSLHVPYHIPDLMVIYPSITTMFILTGVRSASRAASIPRKTFSIFPRSVSCR